MFTRDAISTESNLYGSDLNIGELYRRVHAVIYFMVRLQTELKIGPIEGVVQTPDHLGLVTKLRGIGVAIWTPNHTQQTVIVEG